MRILWFTNNSCKYISKSRAGYNGGGWMTSLQSELSKIDDVKLGICFCMSGEPSKVEQDDVVYYPVPNHVKSKKDKILDVINYNDVERDEILWRHYIEHFTKVINDFKPDVIEVFGSELYTGLATVAAKGLPVVLHLQGLLSLYIYIYLPPGVSKWEYIWKDRSIKQAYANFQTLVYWKRSCYREKEILKAAPHVIGRTDWDRQAMQILNPNAVYHYGGEILRSEFYLQAGRKITDRIVITTIISNPPYKGFDLLLKVAHILKYDIGLDFEWNVYGNVSPRFWENHTGIRCNGVNVNLLGVASAQELREALLGSTLYFHPSYVENSPNSVGEAQILGIPVVATNVGGTSSMVEHGKTGMLFPATDPYMGAYYIHYLVSNMEKNIEIGKSARDIALIRHDKKTIVEKLMETYKQIISDAK